MATQITKQIQTTLETSLLKKLTDLKLPVPKSTLSSIVTSVSKTAASGMVKDVNGTANSNLNDIPKNLIGQKNPVNLITGNQGAQDITNNLSGIVQTKLSDPITGTIISSLQTKLKNALPAEVSRLIDFNNIGAVLSPTLTTLVNKNLDVALNKFSTDIFSTNKPSRTTVADISTLFAAGSSDVALEKIDESFATAITSTALAEAKSFDINNTDNQDKLTVLKTGFVDPSGNYPTKEYAGLSETNKLAQGDARGTIVQAKNDTRMLGAKLPFGESWDQPESAYRGAYPYNKVTETESGHTIEMDDTPGSERLHIYHKSGTFVEIDANGSMVRRIVGSSYEIIDRNGKISISGSADISVNGSCNIFVGNDANIEVEGDVNLKCHNDITAQAGGTLNLSATEEVNITGGNVNVQAYNTMNVMANTALKLHASENISLKANTNVSVQALQVLDLTANAALNVHATKNISLKANADILVQALGGLKNQADGIISNKAGGVYSADGSAIHLNSGNSVNAEAVLAGVAALAGISNIGVMSGRKDPPLNVTIDPQSLTLADNKSLLLEEATQTRQDRTDQTNLIIKGGFATAADLKEVPVAGESSSVSSTQSIAVAPDAKLKKVTELPGNYNLSPSFTVEMLSFKAAVTRDKVKAHGTLTYGDIVYNLQALALNVLEPVKKLYPNMFVTSAFRDPGNASNAKTSQHPLGQGADIQFKGASKQEYYDIAVKLAKVIKYDQFLLEYCNYTNNPWIHISYIENQNRNKVMTFFNHARHSDGLTLLV